MRQNVHIHARFPAMAEFKQVSFCPSDLTKPYQSAFKTVT
jgi:hypothetical protein